MRAAIADYATALYQSAASHPTKLRPIIRNFLTQLRQEKQIKFLPQIMEKLGEIAAEAQDEVIVTARSAEPLTATKQKELSQQLSQKLHKTVRLETVVDTDLIGGITLVIGDLTIDASIAQSLARLTKALAK